MIRGKVLLSAGVLGAISAAGVQAATITWNSGISLSGISSTDALQGLQGVGSGATTASAAGLAVLTDGSASSVIVGPDSNMTVVAKSNITWDLGAAGAASRELDSVTIWIYGGDAFRSGYSGYLAVSNDGVNFTTLTTSTVNYASDNTWAYQGGNSSLGTSITVTFSANEVVGFRYLQLVSTGMYRWPTDLVQSRFAEVDAAVSAVPEISSLGILGLLSSGGMMMRRRRA